MVTGPTRDTRTSGEELGRGSGAEEVMEAAQEGGCCQGPVNRVRVAERSGRMNSELSPRPDRERGHCEPWNRVFSGRERG